MTVEARARLRQSLRQLRRQLNHREQHLASASLYKNLIRQRFFLSAGKIAFYLANDGEIDPEPVLERALELGKSCYLPVISPDKRNKIRFVRYRAGDALRPNRWGILEPEVSMGRLIAPWALDLVLVPLVAFDESGARMGMGKGFYDRTFSFRKKPGRNRPLLAGVAHEFQKVESLPVEHWDIPLDRVVSDQKVYSVQRNATA